MLDKITHIKQRFFSYLEIPSPWNQIVIFVLNVLLVIPLFVVVHQNIIELDWPWNLDRVLLAILLIALIQWLLFLIRKVLVIGVIIYFFILLWGTLAGGYGFFSISQDYGYMLYAMTQDPNPEEIILSKLLPFPNKTRILNAIEYEHPNIRNFALMATQKHFAEVKGYPKYRKIIQYFAVFKEINQRWNYVNDPRRKEYINLATESLIHFSGDCDDHAVMMAACIKAIGGTPRLIHTKGHIYPEVLIGGKAELEAANYLIREVLFTEESKGKGIFYHVDERGQIWLNFDYTGKYPGGPFLSQEILGALTLL